MFVYCNNRPTSTKDHKGSFPVTIIPGEMFTFPVDEGLNLVISVDVDYAVFDTSCGDVIVTFSNNAAGDYSFTFSTATGEETSLDFCFTASSGPNRAVGQVSWGNERKRVLLRADYNGISAGACYQYEYLGATITLTACLEMEDSFVLKQAVKNAKSVFAAGNATPMNPYSGPANAIGGCPVGTYGGGVSFWIMNIR